MATALNDRCSEQLLSSSGASLVATAEASKTTGRQAPPEEHCVCYPVLFIPAQEVGYVILFPPILEAFTKGIPWRMSWTWQGMRWRSRSEKCQGTQVYPRNLAPEILRGGDAVRAWTKTACRCGNLSDRRTPDLVPARLNSSKTIHAPADIDARASRFVMTRPDLLVRSTRAFFSW